MPGVYQTAAPRTSAPDPGLTDCLRGPRIHPMSGEQRGIEL